MTISAISTLIYSNVYSIESQAQLQAIEIFGKDLANALKIRDGSWEKVMKSWEISFTAWKTIKESENNLCNLPKRIYCETQVNDGLIFKASKAWSNEKQKYEDEITEGELITPYGYIYLKFHSTESMEQFIARFEKIFYKQLLDPGTCNAIYSFTPHPKKVAAYKPSYYYDKCGSALEEEFGENEYCRTEALNIYKILSDQVGITIEGQRMPDDIC